MEAQETFPKRFQGLVGVDQGIPEGMVRVLREDSPKESISRGLIRAEIGIRAHGWRFSFHPRNGEIPSLNNVQVVPDRYALELRAERRTAAPRGLETPSS